MLRTALLLASVHSSCQLRAAPFPLPLQRPAPARTVVSPVCKVPRAFRAPPAELSSGAERDGLVSKITDFGCFIKLANENRMGLVHVSTLAPDRLEKEEVPEFLESQVGPVGSKVRVRVMSVAFRGQKRISLQLLDVISKQHVEDMVFARPGDDVRVEEEWAGVDRYNDIEEDEEEVDHTDDLLDDVFDGEEGGDDADDEDEDEGRWILELDEDEDFAPATDQPDQMDPLEALSAGGFALQDGLVLEDVSDTGRN